MEKEKVEEFYKTREGKIRRNIELRVAMQLSDAISRDSTQEKELTIILAEYEAKETSRMKRKWELKNKPRTNDI